MNHDWASDNDSYGPVYHFDGSQADNVVPAEGDPEAEVYRARMRQQASPAFHLFWGQVPSTSRRSHLRRWLIAGAALALGLLFIKPLLLVAAILLALVVGFVLFVILAVGALLLAARLTLGGRADAPDAQGHLARAFLRYSRMGPHWNE